MRLYLCEKPSQGKDIAAVLGAKTRGDGCLRGPGVAVTWGIGHLLETAAPDAYGDHLKNWSLDTLPILPAQWKVIVKPKTASQFKVVKQLLKEATELVIATDADREGEMIARELIEYCGYRGPIQRLWLSALNEASIRQALSSVKQGAETYPLYLSALARSRADWLIGMNFSRLFTLLGRQAGYTGVLSVGRVQTPTLRLVVDRDREIANFIPKPFWNLDVQLCAAGHSFLAKWVADESVTDEEGRCLDQSAAAAALNALKNSQTATAISVEIERGRDVAPLPFDLSTLQEVCSAKFGLGVQETLDVAQALYETHKATTYPRTDCGYLPESMLDEVPMVLDAINRTDPTIGKALLLIDPEQRSRAWNDKKITGPHHGIIPTLEPANLSAMSEKERRVYELIRAHFLAQFLPNHEYDRTVATFESNTVSLQAVGKRIVVSGWKILFSSSSEEEGDESGCRSQTLPMLQAGSRCDIQDLQLKALKTEPPKPYTEGTLVKAMKTIAKLVKDPRLAQKLKETTGIGTEATRAGTIQSLIDRGSLIKKGRALRATEAAFSLIDAVPPAVADPGTTAIWEQALTMIEQGTLTLDDFISRQSSWITRLVDQYKGITLSIKVPEGPRCPLCNAKTSHRKGASGVFWACTRYPECKGTVNIGTGKKKSPGKSAKTRTATTKTA
ncbi:MULTISPECIES: DNA topoisomerase III [Pseudomonas syringae group]|uniref:DNA topoisomerase n=12 Tax=Pseudomonas syringae group TaxID=136849 RepID=A0AAD0DMI0_9PSED|nr:MULTISPECIES: DNA topoisomerase III [Pseudomonas syringae group]AVB13160.1 DNA topoisomerase III [Pseudomonas amygdali pv. morsprunorum]AVB18687.1 DNA topoisomerase III [Pseudomonas avellanae]KWS56421.1 DNA topoisomerase III [Pseudomonas amygdali pv. morsprunorum]KWS63798.1 DNA topoisomerase III [Pseudomonas amygdali pv. morsprunorum]MDT3226954.1 DNA topoisomerase III [Pseudomonas amygdali pv. morsprunorum]